MSNTEFAEIVAYITAGCGKPLSVDAQVVYFDLLGDLPADVLRLGAKKVLLEHHWATFPTVAELRQAAIESVRGEVKELSGAEAWWMAWRIAADTDPEIEGSFDRACQRAKAPRLVVEAVTSMGLLDLCYGEEPVGVVRGQFLKVYDQLAARDRRKALLPPAVTAELNGRRESIGQAIAGRLAAGFALPVGDKP